MVTLCQCDVGRASGIQINELDDFGQAQIGLVLWGACGESGLWYSEKGYRQRGSRLDHRTCCQEQIIGKFELSVTISPFPCLSTFELDRLTAELPTRLLSLAALVAASKMSFQLIELVQSSSLDDLADHWMLHLVQSLTAIFQVKPAVKGSMWVFERHFHKDSACISGH